jgi:hypothetical protein
MDTYGSIQFTSEFAEGILSVAEEYFSRRSPTPNPVRISTSCAPSCPTFGRAGAETVS